MNCTQVDQLAPFYVAGALQPAETLDIATHLSACDRHESSLVRLRSAAALHPSDVVEVKVPPAVKTRLMSAVRADSAPPRRTAPGRFVLPQRVWAGALAVALLIILGLAAWNLELHGATSHNEAFAAALQGANGESGAFYYTEQLEGVIYVEGLSPLPPDKTYQVWAMTGKGPINCGLLPSSPSGASVARMKGEVSPDDRVFVTIEPAGGSASPTGATILSSQLEAGHNLREK